MTTQNVNGLGALGARKRKHFENLARLCGRLAWTRAGGGGATPTQSAAEAKACRRKSASKF